MATVSSFPFWDYKPSNPERSEVKPPALSLFFDSLRMNVQPEHMASPSLPSIADETQRKTTRRKKGLLVLARFQTALLGLFPQAAYA